MRISNRETIRQFDCELKGRLGLIVLTLILLVGMVVVAGCGGDKEEAVPSVSVEAMVAGETSVPAAGDSLSGSELVTEADSLEVGNQDAEVGVGSSGTVATVAKVATVAGTGSAPAQNLISSGSVGPYSLQLGSFQKRSFAEERLGQVLATGLKPVIETVDVNGDTYFRVMVRGISDRSTAQQVGEKLRSRLDITYLIKRAD
ncbi:MAG: SPOR domain-containing protein [Gemmatimonadales bacterium]|nr:SPOR domain-containing protein [Gemmatimonadales bacterium]